jgi:putative transposase
MSMIERERTSAEVVLYALYLYFLGLSFRSTSKAIQPFGDEGRSHVAVWKWVQRFNPKRLYHCKRVSAFLIDETMLQIGPEEAWLWVAVEPVHKQILGVYISRHRNMIVAESFLTSLIKIYGKHIVYSDGGSWYPEACLSLGLEHKLHSPYEKSIVERTIEYLKDRTESFDDYYPCMKAGLCNLRHVHKWLTLIVFMHNSFVKSTFKFENIVRWMYLS